MCENQSMQQRIHTYIHATLPVYVQPVVQPKREKSGRKFGAITARLKEHKSSASYLV